MGHFWLYFISIPFFVAGYFFGKKENRRMLERPDHVMLERLTISGGQHEDAGASSSSSSSERSDSGLSTSVDVRQQQQFFGKKDRTMLQNPEHIMLDSHTFSSDLHEDAGASSSSTSPERSDSGSSASIDIVKGKYETIVGKQQQFFDKKKNRRMLQPPEHITLDSHTFSGDQHEDAGGSSFSTSPERSDSGPSASVDIVKGKNDTVVRQQQQFFGKKNGRIIPAGQHDHTGASSSLTSPERSDSGPSALSTSVIGSGYYVFLSFRGDDTRKVFVDHLYCRLHDVGLYPNFVFRDDENLPFGGVIAAELTSAIMHSKISIPVISVNYASSEWCLRELIQIMECKESTGQTVLPVLYNVKPTDVRHLKGHFGEAFNNHSFDGKVKEQARKALEKAAEHRVLESEKYANGHEGYIVKTLVEIVMRKHREDFQPCLPPYLVGNDDHVAEVMKLVDTTDPETRIIGIYGMGGIGKTTLATIIYHKLSDKFPRCSFLKDIRETIKRDSLEKVQSRLISNILNTSYYQVPDSDRGIKMIQVFCTKEKVLILLDDVDCKLHLDKLIGGCNFKSGSRIIVTCQDKALLEFEYGYEVKEMNDKDSLLLFSMYAFKGKPPPKELVTLSREIVDTTGGLPLALMIIGSFLKNKESEEEWTAVLEQLRMKLNMMVQQKLKISYDYLECDEKKIFLDIACYFYGTDRRIASYQWTDLKRCPNLGLAKMIRRSLIKLNDNNELRMHNQLRCLGRGIARSENENPWLRSRLWDEEAKTVLGGQGENGYIEALHLDEDGSRKFMEKESFKRMLNLKFLHGSAVKFAGNFKESLSELRWLNWERCPEFQPTNVHFENLLILDLSGGNISKYWRKWSSIKMEKLKVLNLSGCSDLKSTPNLSTFNSLEMLILENCGKLEQIDPSIGVVEHLISLNLKYCRSLKILPTQLGELKNLEELVLDETSIQEIPTCIGTLVKLNMLSAYGCESLVRLADSISHLVHLSTLDLRGCFHLNGLPSSIRFLVNLRHLSLGGRNSPHDRDDEGVDSCLSHIPSSIGKLERLTELNLTSTSIQKLPKSIGDLKNLKVLAISRNKNLRKLPSSISKMSKLEKLDVSYCKSLEGKIPIDGLSSLKILRLRSTYISGLPDAMGGLTCLEELDLEGCQMLQSLPKNIGKLPSLKHLDLTECQDLQSLPELPACLRVLRVTCKNHILPQLSHLIYLKELTIESCKSLKSMPELPTEVLKLRVSMCVELTELTSLSNLKLLSDLHLPCCPELTEIKDLKALKSLENLDVSGCRKLSNFDGLEHLESLRWLNMSSFTSSLLEIDGPPVHDDLVQVRGLDKLQNLQALRICGCQSLRTPDLSKLTNLKQLSARRCDILQQIKGLERLKNLEKLDLCECKSIETLPDLSCFSNLKELNIGGCWKLHDIQGLEKVAFVQRW